MYQEPKIKELIAVLQQNGFATKHDLDELAAKITSEAKCRSSNANYFSLSRWIKGLAALKGLEIDPKTRVDDIAYCQKALETGSGSGSYLVPTIQANEIVQYLAQNSIMRVAGARVWPMNGIRQVNVPTATATPTVEYLGQSTAQVPSDPTLGQMPFSLKTARALIAMPNELVRVATPAIDTLIAELLGAGFGESEDLSFFSTTTVTNGPTSIYAASNTSKIKAAGDATSGGDLVYTDILAVMSKAASVKARGPFAWFMGPRTFYERIASLIDLQSRPLLNTNVEGALSGRLMGAPVYISANFPIDQVVASGSAQSFAVYTNPKYIHIAEAGTVEIAISGERYFEANQLAIRGVHEHDFGYAPPAGIVILQGIN